LKNDYNPQAAAGKRDSRDVDVGVSRKIKSFVAAQTYFSTVSNLIPPVGRDLPSVFHLTSRQAVHLSS
jgi:hypothetical protein